MTPVPLLTVAVRVRVEATYATWKTVPPIVPVLAVLSAFNGTFTLPTVSDSAAAFGFALTTSCRFVSVAFSASMTVASVSVMLTAPASSTKAAVKFAVPPVPSRSTTGAVFPAVPSIVKLSNAISSPPSSRNWTFRSTLFPFGMEALNDARASESFVLLTVSANSPAPSCAKSRIVA